MPPKKASDVFVVGNGVTKFTAKMKEKGYADEAAEAANTALAESGLAYSDVEAVVAGYVYGDSTCGQAAAYRLGLSGVPVFNVNNNCATGSTALHLAKKLVESGEDCVLALGFEQMGKNLKEYFPDREKPAQRHLDAMAAAGIPAAPLPGPYTELTQAVLKVYGHGAKLHMEQHATTAEQFAKVAAKNHRHSVHNPHALMQFDITADECQGESRTRNLLTAPRPACWLRVRISLQVPRRARAAGRATHRRDGGAAHSIA